MPLAQFHALTAETAQQGQGAGHLAPATWHLAPGTSLLSPAEQSPCLTTHQLPASWDSEVISASPCTTYYLSRLTADIGSTSAREVAAQGPAGLGLVSWQRWVPQQVSMAV